MPKQGLIRSAASFHNKLPLSVQNSTSRVLMAAMMILSLTCVGQQTPASPPSPDSQPPQQALVQHEPAAIVVPAGTKIPLVLTQTIESKTMRPGDQINTQITAPITVGSQVAIPAGAFLQGKIEKMKRIGTRAEIELQSASLAFPNGYVAAAPGPLLIEGEEWTALRESGKGAAIGAIVAPMAGGAIGVLIGHSLGSPHTALANGLPGNASTVRDTAIGGFVGLAAGSAVSLALLLRGHQFLVDVGSPMEIVLPRPLTLDTNQLARSANQMPAPPVVLVKPLTSRVPMMTPSTTSTGSCYTPGTPGTPPTIIPGTPPMGNSPGTPPTVIPGTPPTPGTSYPCP
jgi:hypothetical protein